MKKICCSFLLLTVLFCSTALAATGVGSIITAKGGAFVIQNGTEKPAVVKDRVQATDVLKTDSTGRIQVLFDDDSTMALAADTRVDLITVVSADNPQFKARVSTGLARFITGKIVEQNPGGFEVNTPRGTVGIRGTIFAVQVAKDADTVFAFSSRHGGVALGKTGTGLQIVPAGSKGILQGSNQPVITPMEPGEANRIEQQVALGIGSGTMAKDTSGEQAGGGGLGTQRTTAENSLPDVQGTVLEHILSPEEILTAQYIGPNPNPGPSGPEWYLGKHTGSAMATFFMNSAFPGDIMSASLTIDLVTGRLASGNVSITQITTSGTYGGVITMGTSSGSPQSFSVTSGSIDNLGQLAYKVSERHVPGVTHYFNGSPSAATGYDIRIDGSGRVTTSTTDATLDNHAIYIGIGDSSGGGPPYNTNQNAHTTLMDVATAPIR